MKIRFMDLIGFGIVFLALLLIPIVINIQLEQPEFISNVCCNGYVCTDTYIENGYCILHECMINQLITNKTICKYKVIEGLDE